VENGVINICLACDDNYAQYAGVTVASILANAASEDNLHIYILDGGISEQHKTEIFSLKSIRDCDITFVSINEELFESYRKIRTPKHISIATFYRLKLASLLPYIDKIIYLDCDIVVNTSLAELFNIDLDGYYIAGVLDIGKKLLKKNPCYVNAGMLVMNLQKFRKDGLEQRFLEYATDNIENIKYGDQDIINNVCNGCVKLADERWNVQSSNFTNRSSYTHNPKIIHFIAKKKPWQFASFSYHRDYYFKYLQLTPWKLSDEDYKHWTKDNQWASLWSYFKYRPLFMLRPRFYKALFYTYLKKDK